MKMRDLTPEEEARVEGATIEDALDALNGSAIAHYKILSDGSAEAWEHVSIGADPVLTMSAKVNRGSVAKSAMCLAIIAGERETVVEL